MISQEEREKRDKAREAFFSSIDSSEEDLEKKITYISAGALALSITFIEKIVDFTIAENFWILISGWFLLITTLSINLISTLISRKFTMKSARELDDETLSETELNKKIDTRNKIISRLDLTSLSTLISGIFLVVLFCSLNLHNKKIENMTGGKDYIEKGKVIQPIRPTTPTTAPSTGNGSGGNSGGSGGSSGGSSSSSDK